MKQVHGVPALLSLFFPGLGQLVKGQDTRAVLIWVLFLAPWIAWVAGAAALIPEVGGTIRYAPEKIPQMLLSVFLSPVLPFVLLLNLIVQLWSVVDAYNRPV